MWELDHKEIWGPKNWCFWTVVLEKTHENSLNYEVIKLVHCKGNQSWIFIERTDAETETPILWPPDVMRWLFNDFKKSHFFKRPWCWERLMVGGKADNRGWDGWMASLTQWIWVWVNSGSSWWTGRPGILQSIGLQSRTRLSNWTELRWYL